jgi:nitric oxide reductase subunit B
MTRVKDSPAARHKWTFYFLMAVGFWNFVGAGVFGFLINLPIVSYFEVGTVLTPNHAHAALMGVFGMLGIALMAFMTRETVSEAAWPTIGKLFGCAFWGLNIGLACMVVLSLFPGGILQVADVIANGYWHARSLDYTASPLARLLEWLRLPGDLIFILLGSGPVAVALLLSYRALWSDRLKSSGEMPATRATLGE